MQLFRATDECELVTLRPLRQSSCRISNCIQHFFFFSIQKNRVVDLLSIKYVKGTSKHLSHGINVVQRQRSSENYFSKLHQNVISIERMLAPSHCLCLSLFSFIRSLLVSESKARGLFRRRRSRSRRLRRSRAVIVAVRLRVVVRMSQRHAFVAYNCSHHALFRLSGPCPSRFSVIMAVVGERLAARVYFRIAYLYSPRRLPVFW